MKQKQVIEARQAIEKRLERYKVLRDCAEVGSETELVLISAMDELDWVLREVLHG